MNKQSLFDMTALPEKVEAPKAKRRWYIVLMRHGKEYALVATHADELEYRLIGAFNHQPLLYKTYAGAVRQARYYANGAPFEVREWKGWK